jgi:hypothetical protein
MTRTSRRGITLYTMAMYLDLAFIVLVLFTSLVLLLSQELRYSVSLLMLVFFLTCLVALRLRALG